MSMKLHRPLSTFVALIAILSLGLAQAVAQNNSSPASTAAPEINRTALADYLRYVNLWPKEVSIEIEDPKASSALPGFFDLAVKVSAGQTSLMQMYLLSPDGLHLVRTQAGDRLGKTVFPVDSYPFQIEQNRLTLTGRPSIGPADAPVTIAVYSDFQCGFCREEAKILRSNLLSAYPDKVRLVFVDFPLTQIHDWAQRAAVAGRCVAAQDPEKFWLYHDWVFEEQPALNATNFGQKLNQWAGENGVDTLRFDRCLVEPSIDDAVKASFQNALDLGLTSTPTLFVNGRQMGGKLEWLALKQVIDIELEYQAAAAKRKEECCAVSLPGIFNQ